MYHPAAVHSAAQANNILQNDTKDEDEFMAACRSKCIITVEFSTTLMS